MREEIKEIFRRIKEENWEETIVRNADGFINKHKTIEVSYYGVFVDSYSISLESDERECFSKLYNEIKYRKEIEYRKRAWEILQNYLRS